MKVTVEGKTNGKPYVRAYEGDLCIISVLTGDSIEIGIYGEGTRADTYALQAMAMVALLKKCDKEERGIVWEMMKETIIEKIEE